MPKLKSCELPVNSRGSAFYRGAIDLTPGLTAFLNCFRRPKKLVDLLANPPKKRTSLHLLVLAFFQPLLQFCESLVSRHRIATAPDGTPISKRRHLFSNRLRNHSSIVIICHNRVPANDQKGAVLRCVPKKLEI
jgi:hypothetical protein